MNVWRQCFRQWLLAPLRDEAGEEDDGVEVGGRGEETPLYVAVLLWRLVGRGAQGGVCLNFSLSLRTGTLISIGPGPHPRKRGRGKHFRAITEGEKKKDWKESRSRGRIATAQQEMLTANLICMQVQGEWRWWGLVVGLGFYSLSNLHVKCWPGQLTGKRGIVCPPNHLVLLSSSPLHRHLSRFLHRAGGEHSRHRNRKMLLHLKSVWTRRFIVCRCLLLWGP